MNKKKILVILLFLLVVGGSDTKAISVLTNSFLATSVWGNQAPPAYGLRLDGFYDGNSSSEVTFGFENVLFDFYDDGTAQLHGLVSVVEFNGSTSSSFVGMSYQLDVGFEKVTIPSDIAKITNYNSAWSYYNINPSGVELISTTDPNDYTNLWTYPDVNGSSLKPLRVGMGANGKNSNFGAAGWLSYEHNYPGGPFGQNGTYAPSSDFLMDLTPVPEPTTLALFGFGLAGAGISRRLKKFRDSKSQKPQNG